LKCSFFPLPLIIFSPAGGPPSIGIFQLGSSFFFKPQGFFSPPPEPPAGFPLVFLYFSLGDFFTASRGISVGHVRFLEFFIFVSYPHCAKSFMIFVQFPSEPEVESFFDVYTPNDRVLAESSSFPIILLACLA